MGGGRNGENRIRPAAPLLGYSRVMSRLCTGEEDTPADVPESRGGEGLNPV